MGKSGKGGAVLGLIGILIGAGGLVFGYIAWSSLTTLENNNDAMQTRLDYLENQNATTSEKPKIYVATYDDRVYLDFDSFKLIPQLNVTYNTTAGDSVLIEYSCQIMLDPYSGTTTINIYFELDEGYASSYIDLRATDYEDYQNVYSSGIMRHNIQNSTAGEHMVQILTYIDEAYTNSWVRFSVLTVTVY
ncbi:MAG: hypothetical protein KAW51_06615 [Candidatus Lokiarchaeota archaeon]|nr:hypothetical protein [Candidatus Lokiarchaeota archaeon]